ncbi:putative KilA-N domain-containing protein [Megavirus vitis]|nr:putative KilA-N domain-containing protein [Megavirus vitis]
MSNRKVRKSNQKPLKSSGSKNNKSIYKNEIKKRNLSKKIVSKKIISETESSESEPEIEIKTYKRPNHKKLKKYVSDNDSDNESSSESESSSSDNDETEEIQERGERKQLYKMMDKNHMNNVVFQDINEQYAYGQYSEFVVIIDKYTGYINATKLCGLNNNGKGFKNWLPNKHSKELIKEVAKLAGIPADHVIDKVSKGLNEIRGSYAHPKLIPHIASWCSCEFALKVSDIINSFVFNEFKKESDEYKDKMNNVVKKKDDKIDKLSKKLDRQNHKIDELLNNNKELMEKNEKMDNRIKRLAKKNDDIYNINQDMLGKIDIISNDRVVKGKSGDDHMFVIVKNNDDPEEYGDDDELYEYSAFRLMKKSYKIRMSEHLERHPEMEIVLKINHSPNSMNLWNRIKTKLGKKKITYSGCNFNLENDYTENKLVRDIKKIHNERLDTDDI